SMLKAEEAKTAGDEDLLPIPGKTVAWTHQKQAFHAALPHPGFMLSMDMGTGKSKTAVALLEGWDVARAVILAPKAVVNVWPNQFALHGSNDWPVDVIVADPMKKVSVRVTQVAQAATLATARKRPFVVVTNYDVCWRPGMKELLQAILAGGRGGVGFS